MSGPAPVSRRPAAVIEQPDGVRKLLVVAQQDPDWCIPEVIPGDGLKSWELLRSLPSPDSTIVASGITGCPEHCANPHEMIGRIVDVWPALGPVIPAQVTVYHGAADLTFQGRAVRVRDLLELSIAELPPLYEDIFGGGGSREHSVAGPALAGRLVTTTHLEKDGDGFQSMAVGLVIAGVGHRLIVVPLADAMAENAWALVPEERAKHASGDVVPPTDADVHSGTGTMLPDDIAQHRHETRISNVQQMIRGDFVNRFVEQGFLDQDERLDGMEALIET